LVANSNISAAESRQLTSVEEKDFLKGTSKFIDLDTGHFGRKSAERFTDIVNGQPVQSEVRFQYRDDSYHGLVPVSAIARDPVTRTELSRVETKSFDPSTRRIVAEEI